VQIQQLVYFVAVAETGHFTRAAELAHVAQPSLSKQIKALETDLGASLFSRARGNIALTPAGEALLPLARRILADVDTARQAVQEVTLLRRGRVRLGATPSLSTGLLPEVLTQFRHTYPGIQLVVQEDGSRNLVRELADGELDLALIILPLQPGDPALSTTPLFDDELVLASASSAPPPTTQDRITIDDLRDQPLVMFRRGYDLRELTVSACQRAGFEPTFAVEGGEMDTVLSFVRAGLGVAVVPEMVLEGGVYRITRFTEPGLSRTVGVAHRKDVQPTRAARALRSTLLAYLEHIR
jgi:DNA-binding transcriptional LysR family regulator